MYVIETCDTTMTKHCMNVLTEFVSVFTTIQQVHNLYNLYRYQLIRAAADQSLLLDMVLNPTQNQGSGVPQPLSHRQHGCDSDSECL